MQRSAYSHPDLHDELMEELVSSSSPFSEGQRSSAAVVNFKFLLLGDQNAGKSTFLHAFTHAGDENWLELNSILPILSSTFVNAQLHASDGAAKKAAMDEPPFLDTDVGRASFLVTLEDFAMFADEFALPLPLCELECWAAAGARYASIELVEIGGDHLDRMMRMSHVPCGAPLELAVRRSEQLVGATDATLYFLHAATLLTRAGLHQPCGRHSSAPGTVGLTKGSLTTVQGFEVALDGASTVVLARRLRYLASIASRGQRVLLYLSRLPEGIHFTEGQAAQSVANVNAAIHPSHALDVQSLCRRAAARSCELLEATRDRTLPSADLPEQLLHTLAPPPPEVVLLCTLLSELLTDVLQADLPGSDPLCAFDVALAPMDSLQMAAASTPQPEAAEGSSARVSRACAGSSKGERNGNGADRDGARMLQIQPAMLACHIKVPTSGAAAERGASWPPTPHTTPRIPELDVYAVLATLSRLFEQHPSSVTPDRWLPRAAATSSMLTAAASLLECFRDVASRLTDTTVDLGSPDDVEADGRGGGAVGKRRREHSRPTLPHDVSFFEPWVTQASWEAHLESRHAAFELPVNTLVGMLQPLATALSDASLALMHHADGHAHMHLAVEFRAGDEDSGRAAARPQQGMWQPATSAAVLAMSSRQSGAPVVSTSKAEFGVRFPYFPPLLEAIEAQLVRGLPAEWWLHLDSAGQTQSGGAVNLNDEGATCVVSQAQLRQVGASIDLAAVRRAEAALRHRLQSQLHSCVRADHPASWHVFIWLLEDFCLARDLLTRGEADGTCDTAVSPHQLTLFSTERLWRERVLPFLAPVTAAEHETTPAASASVEATRESAQRPGPRWRVQLVIIEAEDGQAVEDTMCEPCR